MNYYRKLWIKHKGPIPKDWEGRSYDIHHIDKNRNNNVIENLRCVSIREHYDIHWFQGDWGACLAIARKMRMSPKEISHLTTLQNNQRVLDKIHPFLGGKIQSKHNNKRVKNGTHPFLGSELQNKRVKDGTHPWSGSEHNNKRIADGTHPICQQYECPHCGKIGKGINMFRWHFDNCKVKETIGEKSLALGII